MILNGWPEHLLMTVTIPVHTVVTIEAVHGVKLIVKEKRRVSNMAGIIIFIVRHRTCTLDPGILYPYRTTGVCNRN